jgi:hypothetical protein
MWIKMQDNDIVTIDASGTIFKVRRSTFSKSPVLLAMMTNWNDNKIQSIFIDEEAQEIENLVRALRGNHHLVEEKYA